MRVETQVSRTDSVFVSQASELYQVIAIVDSSLTGSSHPELNHDCAVALANAGYTMQGKGFYKAGAQAMSDILEILTTVEFQTTGSYRPAVVRKTAKELIAQGCSK